MIAKPADRIGGNSGGPLMDRARWTLLLVGLLVVSTAAGCNPITALALLLGGRQDKVPPEYALEPASGKKEIKVLVLTSASLNISEDFIGADRMLASEFTKTLSESAKANKQKLTVVPTSQVEKYKQDRPGSWRAQDPTKIGKHFEVDYVIDLEVLRLSLYQPKSRELMHGRVTVGVAAYNLNKPDDEPQKSE